VTCVHVVPTHTQNSHLLSLTHSHMGVVHCEYGEKGVHETLSFILEVLIFWLYIIIHLAYLWLWKCLNFIIFLCLYLAKFLNIFVHLFLVNSIDPPQVVYRFGSLWTIQKTCKSNRNQFVYFRSV